MLTEDSPLVKIAGKAAAPALEKNKGLRTVGDLLDFVPRRYLPPAELTDLAQLREGEEVMVIARVARATTRPMQRRKGQMLNVVLTDGRAELDVTFFSSYAHRAKLVPGVTGFFAGTVGRYRQRWQLTHPDYELFADDDDLSRVEDYRSRRIPVYSATGKIYSFKIRRMVDQALDSLDSVREPVPEEIRRSRGLLDRTRALELVHRPRVDEDPEVGLDRLRYDEALVLQTILAQRRRAAEAVPTTPRLPRTGGLLAAFDARLPFELTEGQRAVGEVLTRELALSRPMHRLLQGEVGSGKTVVALRAMLAAIDAGGQAALLAPTEVLAAQHHRSITTLLGDLAEGGMLGGSDIGTKVALLTGSQGASSRKRALLDAASGEAGIVVGTHALIQRHVQFADLALVVVDEQHRFGVEQRDALREKNARPPHLLVMTATPIPRTVAMTVFGDMETSTLSELPRGRSPVTTHVVEADKPAWVARTWQRVAEEVADGRQAYVVCPRIGDPGGAAEGAAEGAAAADSSDEEALDWDVPDDESVAGLELTGVHDMLAELRAKPELDGVRLGLLHGRLDADTREQTMRAFHAREIDVLVATTVIEVGVDVPNATVMVVVDADRFGISQLHQLRGRVGRGTAPGLCLLLTRAAGGPAAERLARVAETSDGFELARADLLFRKEGDILGARQSGRASSIRHLRLGRARDEQIIADAREDAFRIVAEDPELRRHPALAAAVAMRLDEEQAAYLEKG
ncbi:MAG TPA: ATP-dependent DNA helicase RecG [Intrasporangium sp.]|uniref:ATP-dependent DNA helicase RecG n=1 Tax=Intrasporangium sp. TaxID=1925024 RepID=UPI002D77C1B1|nr:ATP-dependent DNA helicase RecG [Intrasporangium sp.]HET7399245.1 ATP-dependent DNA helicase RecG [Intrasporangium sp.]